MLKGKSELRMGMLGLSFARMGDNEDSDEEAKDNPR